MAKESQRRAGAPAQRRGQQMGDKRSNANQQAKSEAKTPPLSGKRKAVNKLFADKSSVEIGSDATGPSSTSPSVPAAIPLIKRRRRK